MLDCWCKSKCALVRSGARTVSLIFCPIKPSLQYTHSLEKCPRMPREGGRGRLCVCGSVFSACRVTMQAEMLEWHGHSSEPNSGGGNDLHSSITIKAPHMRA